MKEDNVNSPTHYTQGNVECIDAIESALGIDGFKAFLRGQIIKYQWRIGLKHSASEDNLKSIWYANKLNEIFELERELEKSQHDSLEIK